jgi:hypothetical protein
MPGAFRHLPGKGGPSNRHRISVLLRVPRGENSGLATRRSTARRLLRIPDPRQLASAEIRQQRQEAFEKTQDRFLDRPPQPLPRTPRSHRRTQLFQRVLEVGRGRRGGVSHQGVLLLSSTVRIYRVNN